MAKIAFIGGGNMAEAIIKGLDKAEYAPREDIGIFDIAQERLDLFAEMGHQTFSSEAEATAFAEYLVLSIKPQQMDIVMSKIAPTVKSNTVVVSIVAGATAEQIRAKLGNNSIAVVPTMPNTPLLIGKGATAVGRVPGISNSQFEYAKGLFAASGAVWEIPAEKLNDIIPAGGSAPAYIYYFAKLICDPVADYGFDKQLVKEMFAHTLIGAGQMILDSGDDIDTLIDKVCSKGGCTIEGINAFQAGNMPQIVADGVAKCVNRAYELGENK